MSTAEQYDRTYYENGVAARVSGYTNYHWRPEYSLPFAAALKRRFIGRPTEEDPARVLDYGCAKGFLVKALRLLKVNAWGYDISHYAIENCDPVVKEFVSSEMRKLGQMFSVIVSKDVLEHVPHGDIGKVLFNISNALRYRGVIVVTVPLGDNDQYRIREYELDATHRIRENEEWWIKTFEAAGLFCDDFYYDFPGAKDHWLSVNPIGNATFILRKRGQW